MPTPSVARRSAGVQPPAVRPRAVPPLAAGRPLEAHAGRDRGPGGRCRACDLGRSPSTQASRAHQRAAGARKDGAARSFTGDRRGNSRELAAVLDRIRIPRPAAAGPGPGRTGPWPTWPTASALTAPGSAAGIRCTISRKVDLVATDLVGVMSWLTGGGWGGRPVA